MIALLGESPGASTSVAIMLDVLKYNFADHLEAWEPKIKEMIPSFGESLAENTDLLQEVDRESSRFLRL